MMEHSLYRLSQSIHALEASRRFIRERAWQLFVLLEPTCSIPSAERIVRIALTVRADVIVSSLAALGLTFLVSLADGRLDDVVLTTSPVIE